METWIGENATAVLLLPSPSCRSIRVQNPNLHVSSSPTTGFSYRPLLRNSRSSAGSKRIETREREMGSNEDWRRNIDTHKMSTEEVKAAGVEASKRPPGHNPGSVLHQRRSLPYSATTMAAVGLFVVGTIGYLALYALKKPEASAMDVAKVATNVAEPEDTKPRKNASPGEKKTLQK